MRHFVLDSATGDDVGEIDFAEYELDSTILQTLIESGLLDGETDDYTVDRNYFMADGSIVVLDPENTPVLTLEPEEEVDEDDDEDEDDDSDEDEEEDFV